MTYQELIECYPWIDLAWEVFKGVSPTVIALITIFITEFFVRKRNKADKKREIELQYLEKMLSWIHDTRRNVFEISSSLNKVLAMKDITERMPKLNEVIKQLTEMNQSIFILSDTYKEISFCMGYDFKLDQFKDAIICYSETVNKIGCKYLNYINTEDAIKEIRCMNAQVNELIKESALLLVAKISLLYGKRRYSLLKLIGHIGEKLMFKSKKMLYTPYGFDEKVEYKIYNQIGEKHHKEFLGKKKKRKEKFLSFDKYSDWEKYFKEKFLKDDFNAINFEHYLNRMHRRYIRNIELYKAIAIPLYIGEFQCLISIYQSNTTLLILNGMLLMAIALTVIFSFYSIFKFSNKASFFEDCIKIITSHQK